MKQVYAKLEFLNIKPPFRWFLLDRCMQDFFLNLTKIIESNTRIYWSIIFGVAACLLLYIAEIFHVDHIITLLNTKDQQILAATIDPITDRYGWARMAIIVAAVLWANWEFLKAKKKLGLKP